MEFIGVMCFSMVAIFVLVWFYYGLRKLFTGEPGPFDTVTFTDDGSDATYKKIIGYLEDDEGPKIILNMPYSQQQEPNNHQAFLIQKSTEENSRIEIKVHLE